MGSRGPGVNKGKDVGLCSTGRLPILRCVKLGIPSCVGIYDPGETLLRHSTLQRTQWKESTLLTLRNKSLGEVGKEKEKERNVLHTLWEAILFKTHGCN